MEARSCLGRGVDCYNAGIIFSGKGAIVSQKLYLYSARHDYNDRTFPLIAALIVIGKQAWICWEAVVEPGVTISESAVVAACAVIVREVDADMAVGKASNIGGVVMLLGVFTGLTVVQLPSSNVTSLLIASSLLVMIGILDDKYLVRQWSAWSCSSRWC